MLVPALHWPPPPELLLRAPRGGAAGAAVSSCQDQRRTAAVEAAGEVVALAEEVADEVAPEELLHCATAEELLPYRDAPRAAPSRAADLMGKL